MASQLGPRVLYLTDSAYCVHTFSGLTNIMVGVNYSLPILRENTRRGKVDIAHKTRILKSHMRLETFKDMLKENDLSKVEEIHLLHASNNNLDTEDAKRQVQEISGKAVYVA